VGERGVKLTGVWPECTGSISVFTLKQMGTLYLTVLGSSTFLLLFCLNRVWGPYFSGKRGKPIILQQALPKRKEKKKKNRLGKENVL
jgi:hypothetical protein